MQRDDADEDKDSKNDVARGRDGDDGRVRNWFVSDDCELHDLSSLGNPILTRGAFGEISLGLRRDDGTERCRRRQRWHLVAIKTIADATIRVVQAESTSQQLTREVFNEVCALRALQGHPNIVPLLGVRSAVRGVSLVFPYRPVDLHTSLVWRERAAMPLLPFRIVTLLSHDVLSALAHCHARSVVHRDVKPGNILITSVGVAQLCDFGLAKPFQEWDGYRERTCTEAKTKTVPAQVYNAPISKGLCTLFYRPPEVLLGGSASSPASDMFSFGLVLAELINGMPPFPGSNLLDQLSLLFEFLGTPTSETWPDVQRLPDYGKLSFHKKTPKDWKDQFPRTTENQPLFNIINETVKLDPYRRWTATSALRQIELASGGTELRQTASLQLIPPQLHEPVLLPSTDDLSLASNQSLRLASTRRTIFAVDAISGGKDGVPLDCQNMEELCGILLVQ